MKYNQHAMSIRLGQRALRKTFIYMNITIVSCIILIWHICNSPNNLRINPPINIIYHRNICLFLIISITINFTLSTTESTWSVSLCDPPAVRNSESYFTRPSGQVTVFIISIVSAKALCNIPKRS